MIQTFKRSTMPEISRFYGIIIRMYYKDHNPPHFHAIYGEYKAEIDIMELRILSGSLPVRAKRMVKEWAQLHKPELIQNWNKLTRLETPNKIEPLD